MKWQKIIEIQQVKSGLYYTNFYQCETKSRKHDKSHAFDHNVEIMTE